MFFPLLEKLPVIWCELNSSILDGINKHHMCANVETHITTYVRHHQSGDLPIACLFSIAPNEACAQRYRHEREYSVVITLRNVRLLSGFKGGAI